MTATLLLIDDNMRTTVTLDPGTEKLLRSAVRERGAPFKAVLNDAIRKGLSPCRPSRPRRFVQKTYDLGSKGSFPWDKALAMADAMEDEEIVRKMSLRKWSFRMSTFWSIPWIGTPLHRKAKSWLEERMSGTETIGLPWNVLLAFLRITTRHGALRHPLSPAQAFHLVDAWLDQPAVTVLHPGPRHVRLLRDLLEPLGLGGNLTSDAHLAAIVIEHGAELCSSDTDFLRFQGLRWRNPLTELIPAPSRRSR
jgi:toxin-antitoxin system PIN domain toxin